MYSVISTVASHSQSPQDGCIHLPDSALQLHASSAEGIISYAFMKVSDKCLYVGPRAGAGSHDIRQGSSDRDSPLCPAWRLGFSSQRPLSQLA